MSENYPRHNLLDMSLTPGATLQNHKYVIQKVLHQSDFGVTYQAHHTYLEQPVVLQTLNESLRQRGDFAQLRQQFLNTIRSLAQQPVENARVLDCFEEGEAPFVVFELTSGQASPQLRDWFPLLPQTMNPIIAIPEAEPSLETVAANAPATELNPSLSSSILETQPPIPASVIAPIPSTSSDLVTPTAISPAQTLADTQPTLSLASPIAMPSTDVMVLPKSRSNIWMPIALISMSVLGGLLGAGFGLSLRLAPTTQARVENSPKTPNLFFSREQNFPAESDWPIAETPLFPSDPTPIEEPVYRVAPPIEDYSQPAFQSLPETQVQQPVLPSPSEPAAKATAPSKPELPLDPIFPSPIAVPDVTITAPPSVLKSAPAAPVEPDPPPPLAPPELPAPAATELPIPEAAPPIPALPVQEPSVIKQ